MKRLLMFLSLAGLMSSAAMAQTQTADKAQATAVKSEATGMSASAKTAGATTETGGQTTGQSQTVSTPDPNAPVVINKNVVINSRPEEQDPAQSFTNN